MQSAKQPQSFTYYNFCHQGEPHLKVCLDLQAKNYDCAHLCLVDHLQSKKTEAQQQNDGSHGNLWI